MASRFFCTSKNHLTTGFSQKTVLVYCCNNTASLLNEAKTQTFRSIANFKSLKFTWISSASQPAVRPTSARCTAPESSHNKGNHCRFTNCKVCSLRHSYSFYPSFSFLVLLYSFKLGLKRIINLLSGYPDPNVHGYPTDSNIISFLFLMLYIKSYTFRLYVRV